MDADASPQPPLQPNPIWSCWRTRAGKVAVGEASPPEDSAYRWLHLDLWDRRSLLWVEEGTGLPPVIRALFTERDAQPSAAVEQGFVALVLPDLEREFDRTETARVGALHVVIGPRLALTGRFHALHTPDVIRHRAAWASAIDATSALDLVLGGIADTIGARSQSLASELLVMEDQFLADERTPDARALINRRRLSARLHRMVVGLRTALARLDGDPALPAPFGEVIQRYLARVRQLDADVGAVQAQLRLLREELDLQAGQQTNNNVYLLSIITALAMPATLVTGFFGMNTGGLPFGQASHGTLVAFTIALMLSGATWLVLRLLGLIRS